MRRIFMVASGVFIVAAAITLTVGAASPAPKAGPRLVPVAETKLLMEGLAHPNFRGLEKLLKEKPADVEAWTFARGQALLIAETGNLLMLRPPRGPAERSWMDRASELRGTGTNLAKVLAARDYENSRKTLALLANTCNACHQSFKVKRRIVPFAEADKTEE